MTTLRVSRRDFLRGRGGALPVAELAEQEGVQPSIQGDSYVVALEHLSCLGSLHQVCGVCAERCPNPGVIRMTGLLPSIDATRCDGCAKCVDACPAPRRALHMVRRT